MSDTPQQRFPALFAPRPDDSHKGSFGTLAIIGGAAGMGGALVLAASAALLSGCGRVFAAFCQAELPAPWIAAYPEIMLATAQSIFAQPAVDTWAIGCGLGTDARAQQALVQAIECCGEKRQALVADADALNLLAAHPALGTRLADLPGICVLTPHPAEAARLLGCHTADIQADREHSARALAEKYRAWIVLKSHASLIADPHGKLIRNDSGNPALATAGSGDVLTGMIAAFLAQKIPPEQAVAGAVWLHGQAADEYRLGNIPLIGMTAGGIAPQARHIRQRLSAEKYNRDKNNS